MKHGSRAAAVLLVAAAVLAGCRDEPGAERSSNTAVLGGHGPGPAQATGAAPLADAQGEPIPAPPTLPAGVPAQLARSGDTSALALWVQDGQVVAASFDRPSGWSAPRPLEQIYGAATDPQLASNGRGLALAVWRHTVGSIQSLRYSRFEAATGWSAPDVVPGALPRPAAAGAAGDRDAPQLEMDPQGNATARWPSGFDPAEVQVARYTSGQGWSPAVSERLAAAAPPASAASR